MSIQKAVANIFTDYLQVQPYDSYLYVGHKMIKYDDILNDLSISFISRDPYINQRWSTSRLVFTFFGKNLLVKYGDDRELNSIHVDLATAQKYVTELLDLVVKFHAAFIKKDFKQICQILNPSKNLKLTLTSKQYYLHSHPAYFETKPFMDFICYECLDVNMDETLTQIGQDEELLDMFRKNAEGMVDMRSDHSGAQFKLTSADDIYNFFMLVKKFADIPKDNEVVKTFESFKRSRQYNP